MRLSIVRYRSDWTNASRLFQISSVRWMMGKEVSTCNVFLFSKRRELIFRQDVGNIAVEHKTNIPAKAALVGYISMNSARRASPSYLSTWIRCFSIGVPSWETSYQAELKGKGCAAGIERSFQGEGLTGLQGHPAAGEIYFYSARP